MCSLGRTVTMCMQENRRARHRRALSLILQDCCVPQYWACCLPYGIVYAPALRTALVMASDRTVAGLTPKCTSSEPLPPTAPEDQCPSASSSPQHNDQASVPLCAPEAPFFLGHEAPGSHAARVLSKRVLRAPRHIREAARQTTPVALFPAAVHGGLHACICDWHQ